MSDSVILLSGGLDSAALAYSLEPDLAVTIDYGQVCAEAEVHAATQICDALDLDHRITKVDCSDLGIGSMAEGEQIEIASTPEWWPFRNQFIITIAAMDVIRDNADKLILGVVKEDRQHADGTPEFIELMDEVVSFQEGSINVSAPAINQTSTELVRSSQAPLSLLGWTHSCHQSNIACGSCRGCDKRMRTMNQISRPED